jgi:hypothetical protein
VDVALNRVLASVAPGHLVNWQGGVYVLDREVVSRASGSLTQPVTVRGYTHTPGDADAPCVVLDASALAVDAWRVTGSHWLIENLSVEGEAAASGSGFRLGGDGVVAQRCAVRGVGADGFVISGRGAGCIGCEAEGFGFASPAAGFRLTGPFAFATGCVAWRGSGRGFEWGAAAQLLAYCIASGNSNAGFWSNVAAEDYPSWMLHCVAARNGGSGLMLVNTVANRRVYAQNCLFEQNGAFGIAADRDAKGAATLLGCAFSHNTLGAVDADTVVHPLPASTEATEAQLRDPVAGDFRLRPGARSSLGAGWPGGFLREGALSAWSGRPDVGAAQQPVRPVINPLWTGDC